MKKLKLFLTVWTVGVLAGIIFKILRLTKRVEIYGHDNLSRCLKEFASGNKSLIVMCNHPSLWEPAILPFLFFPKYLVSLKFVPFSLPDKKNFFDKRWFIPFRQVCIPISRESPREELRTIFMLRDELKKGKIFILHPEGGRTQAGTEFKFSVYQDKIKKFPKGIERLFLGSNCVVVPVWTEGGENVVPNKRRFPRGPYFLYPKIWEKTKLFVGEPFRLPENVSKGEIREFLEDKLLEASEIFRKELA